MRFELTDINGRVFRPEYVVSYELSREVGAACDGLRLNFLTDGFTDEFCGLKAYLDDKLIFNGFCDNQKTTRDETGFRCFIYARSSASLLVDNEATPCEYNCPTARQLWYSNARDLGFACGLPELYSENSYLISKGTSCFGVINDFVVATGGVPIYVTPDNIIKAFAFTGKAKRLDSFAVVSLTYVINRSEVISDIDYKISASDAYARHYRSNYANGRGIHRKRLYNLSAVPMWQRELTAREKIKKSLEEYQCVEAILCGECDIDLFDTIKLFREDTGLSETFFVSEIVRSKNKNGEMTNIVMKKNLDGELVNYVAQ